MQVPSAEDEEAFHGDIDVNLCLDKPVNIMLQMKQSPLFGQRKEPVLGAKEGVKASVTLPKDTLTTLNAHSSDTARDIIKNLTKKFNILDDWKGFALYEQTVLKNDKGKTNTTQYYTPLRHNTVYITGCKLKAILSQYM